MFSRDVALRIFFLLVGIAPIASLSGAIFEIVPLHISFKFVILPAYGLAIIVGIAYWNVGRLALMGLFAGIIAVMLYDLTRWPWVITGLWGDFIPNIGGWMFDNSESDWVWGYLWRYLGNGGGMGMAFFMGYSLFHPLARRPMSGTLYGLSVFSCLVGTLLLAPRGQEMLFTPSLLSVTMGAIGHIVFGSVLGYLAIRWEDSTLSSLQTGEIIDSAIRLSRALRIRTSGAAESRSI